MTSVGSLEAKTQLPALLERVANGEKILITRRGRPVAMLAPPAPEPEPDVKEAIRKMKALRRGNKLDGITIEDLIEESRRH